MAKSEQLLAEALRADQPIDRLAQPEEIAEAVRFPLSDGAAYITRSPLWVDGEATAATAARPRGMPPPTAPERRMNPS